MSESDENNDDSEAQIAGGRASTESVSEFLKEFKSARMSFEPLDTWLFVKARDDDSNDVESVSDTNNVSASSESDSSVVYHFDSDEVSSNDETDGDIAHDVSGHSGADSAGDDCDKRCDEGKTLIVKNLANSPGQSGCGIKVFSEADQSNILEDDDYTSSDVSLEYKFSSRNSVKSVQKCNTDSHQPALSSAFCVKPQSGACSYNTYEVCDDRALIKSAFHENIMHKASKCYEDVHNACDILDNFEASSENSSEFVVDTSYVSRRRANHPSPVNVESPARSVCDDSTAECNSDVDSKTEISDTLKRMKKRQRIAQELLDTEATYQQHLELIVQV